MDKSNAWKYYSKYAWGEYEPYVVPRAYSLPPVDYYRLQCIACKYTLASVCSAPLMLLRMAKKAASERD